MPPGLAPGAIRLAYRAIPALVSRGDTGDDRKPKAEPVKLLPSDVLTILALYVLVHCSVYLWYQTRRQRSDARRQSMPAPGSTVGTDTPGRRRVASGIHHSEHRKRALVRIAMALAALTLAGTVISSIGGQG
jgi:hypothetical protein